MESWLFHLSDLKVKPKISDGTNKKGLLHLAVLFF
jgi:hypothetical protein